MDPIQGVTSPRYVFALRGGEDRVWLLPEFALSIVRVAGEERHITTRQSVEHV
jgi:hypothetical protein